MAEQLDFTKLHLLRNERECEAAIRRMAGAGRIYRSEVCEGFEVLVGRGDAENKVYARE